MGFNGSQLSFFFKAQICKFKLLVNRKETVRPIFESKNINYYYFLLKYH